MSAHALCRCGEQGGTAQCPVHGSQYPTRTVSLSRQPVPPVRCEACGEALVVRWDTGATLDDIFIAVQPHQCPMSKVPIIDASTLSDEELIVEAMGRGLLTTEDLR